MNPWIDDAVDSTIDALIQEQREEASRGRALEDPDDRVYYAELALAFQVSDLEARLACMVLNDLPELHRRAFFSTFYLGRSVEAFARDSDLPAAAIAKALQEVGIAVVRRIAEARRRRKGGRGGRF